MLRSYTFIETDHQKLHNFVISFFDRIEFESGVFRLDLFEVEFRPIIKRHRTILKDAFEEIYNEIKKWEQYKRTRLCEEIRQSNDVVKICAGNVTPRHIVDTDAAIYKKIRTLFLKLYNNVLDGNPVHDELGITLRQHFEAFREANKHITICPMCGISELKTEHDTTRDQYDHYIPKGRYPLSSINFHNLIPTCKECNSFDAKGETDVVKIRNTKLFYPYDQDHKGIEVNFIVEKDSVSSDNIKWTVVFKCSDGKEQEIDAWKKIYNIEDRYLGFVKGRIEKWYTAYWEYLKDDELHELSDKQKEQAYFASLKADEFECLSIIRKPACLHLLALVV